MHALGHVGVYTSNFAQIDWENRSFMVVGANVHGNEYYDTFRRRGVL